MLSPRPYQLDAINRVGQAICAGRRRILVVAPTGAGKTLIAAFMILTLVGRGKRVLFVAHRRELINQCVDRLIDSGVPEDQIGVVMANDPRRRPTAPVQVASIDTLRHRAKPNADVVIIDESHRSTAAGYVAIREAYPNALYLGLTATPYRADGRGLGDVFEVLIVVASPRELIALGFLVEPRVFTVPSKNLPDLSSVKTKGGDYDERELAEAVDRKALVGNIVEHWQKLAGGVRTVAFAVSVEHSKNIAAEFVEAGVAAEHLDGTTPTLERDAILARLQRGETRVVSNCGILQEGWDMPAVKCAILARPTKSTGLYLQQAGRILRPFENLGALILDHSGNVVAHGLPQADREFSLDVTRRRPKQVEVACKTCERCFAILPAATRVCPSCHFEFPFAEAKTVPETRAGELVEVRPPTLEEKRAEWDRLCAVAIGRKFAEPIGWARHKFKDKFGHWPPSTFPAPKYERPVASNEQKRAYVASLVEQMRANGHRVEWAFIRFKARFGEPLPVPWLREAQAPYQPPTVAQESSPATQELLVKPYDWLKQRVLAAEAAKAAAPTPEAAEPTAAEELVEWQL